MHCTSLFPYIVTIFSMYMSRNLPILRPVFNCHFCRFFKAWFLHKPCHCHLSRFPVSERLEKMTAMSDMQSFSRGSSSWGDSDQIFRSSSFVKWITLLHAGSNCQKPHLWGNILQGKYLQISLSFYGPYIPYGPFFLSSILIVKCLWAQVCLPLGSALGKSISTLAFCGHTFVHVQIQTCTWHKVRTLNIFL